MLPEIRELDNIDDIEHVLGTWEGYADHVLHKFVYKLTKEEPPKKAAMPATIPEGQRTCDLWTPSHLCSHRFRRRL